MGGWYQENYKLIIPLTYQFDFFGEFFGASHQTKKLNLRDNREYPTLNKLNYDTLI